MKLPSFLPRIKLFLLASTLSLLSSIFPSPTAAVFPGATWTTKTPLEVGLDSTKLDQFATNLGTGAGVIVKDGYIVKSWGSQTTKFDWASASKPLHSTMLFFAVKEGLISSVNDPIYDQGWALTSADQSITYYHLANQVSGYARAENPGAAWAYNDTALNLYVKTLYDYVFTESTPNADVTKATRLGAIGLQDGSILSSRGGYGVSTTPRDFARVGWFWLNKGNWDGTQLLAQSYFDTYMVPHVSSSTPRTTASDTDYLGVGSYGGGSDITPYGPGIYGFNWWFNPTQSVWPSLPADALEANGHFGTEVMLVIPSMRMVVAAKGSWGTFTPGSTTSTEHQNLSLIAAAAAKPLLTLTAFSPDPTSDTTPTLSASAIDATAIISSVEYQMDSTSGSWSACTADDGTFDEESEAASCTPTALSEGSHTMNVRTTNGDGDVSVTSSDTFVVDSQGPTVSLTAITPDPTSNASPSITGTATDGASALSAIQYQVDSTAGSWSACSADDGAVDEISEAFTCNVSATLSNASHTIYVRSSDATGLYSSNASDTFTVSSVTTSWTQTDWSGGPGQTAWSVSNMFDTSSSLVYSTSGQLTLTTSGWYGTAWTRRKLITVDAAQVAGSTDFTSFPVLVNMTDTDLAADALDSGFDILFTANDGTSLLDFEIQSFNGTTGALVAWIRIPTLSATTDTPFYLYYRNPAAVSSLQNPTGVWDTSYQAVWHLDEASGTRSDATTKGNTLTDNNTVTSGTGKIGVAASFDNTLPEYLSRTDGNLSANFPGKSTSSSTGVTVSAWANFGIMDGSHSHNMITKTSSDGLTSEFYMWAGSTASKLNTQFSTGTTVSSTTFLVDTWYYTTMVWNGTNVQIYINGAADGTAGAMASFPTTTNMFKIGTRWNNTVNRSMNGLLDEIRVSNTARSADWIATEYANQNTPSTFYSVGTVQTTQYASTGTLTSSIFDTTQSNDWGILSFTNTVPAGSSVSVKARTSNSSTMTGADAFATCTGLTSGADISGVACVSDTHRYIQYLISLANTDSSVSPTFSDITVNYAIHNESPTVSLTPLAQDPTSDTTPTLSGTASDSDGLVSVVESQMDGTSGSWTSCVSDDGAFDETSETFTCTSSALADGSHTMYVRATDNQSALSTNSSSTFSVDTVAPVISSVTATPGTTTADITWTTDTNASSLVNYGVNQSYGSTTAESDTSPRVTSHSVSLSGLLTCTTYNFSVQSKDSALNTTNSSDSEFTTSGCTGSAAVISQSSTPINYTTGGTADLMDNFLGIGLQIPVSYSTVNSQFQIKQLDGTAVLAATGSPSGYSLVDNYMYDLKSLTDSDSTITTFDNAITVTVNYETADVSALDESTLRIYRWDGSAWNSLSSCSVDLTANSVSCQTLNFSVFALFGQAPAPTPTPTTVPASTATPTSVPSSSSSGPASAPVCTDTIPTKQPRLYAASAISTSEVTINFYVPESDAYDHFILEYGTSSGHYIYGVSNIGNRDSSRYTVKSLQPATMYYFRIRSANGCAVGPASNEISAKTPALFSGPMVRTEVLPSPTPIVTPTPSPIVVPSHTPAPTPVTAKPPLLYQLELQVVDSKNQPLPGTSVELHSTPRSGVTDQSGKVRFDGVEAGEHRILISYNNYQGEQSIFLSGENQEVQATIQVSLTNTFPSNIVIAGFTVAGFIILVLLFLLFKARRRQD